MAPLIKGLALCATVALLGLTSCRKFAGYAAAPGDLSGPRDLVAFDLRGDLQVPDLPGADGPPDPCIDPALKPLLRFTFDEPPGSDNKFMSSGTLARPGTLFGASWSLDPVGFCGKALVFSPTTQGPSYLQVNHETFFDLKEGAVELWVRFDRDAGPQEGIISRDAQYQNESGHLTLLRRPSGHLVARLQGLGSINGHACMGASKFVKGQWHHVEIDFGGAGPLALWVDGEQGLYDVADGVWTCGDVAETVGLGIDGNHNPWLIGASAMTSSDGLGTADAQLVGAIDEVRLYDHRLHP